MSELLEQTQEGWFLFADSYHRDSLIHFIEKEKTRSICGRADITQANASSVMFFTTIDNMQVGDICRVCLRQKL